MNVEVLLSAYKGDRYIADQINSIVDQTFPGNINIRIRDDGSPSGDIMGVIRSAGFHDTFNRHFYFCKGQNVGAPMSFIRLLRKADEADYYFFADQDDIWEKNKIETMVNAMKEMPDGIKLCCCGYNVVDREMKPIAEGNIPYNAVDYGFLKALFYNVFPGCVMGFDRGLAELMSAMSLTGCMMHDRYLFATAVSTGNVRFIDTPLVLHRIHEENVIGYGTRKIHPLEWLAEKKHLFFAKETYDVTEFAGELLRVASEHRVKLKYFEDILLLRHYRDNLGTTISLLRNKDLRNDLSRNTLSIYSRLLFHII